MGAVRPDLHAEIFSGVPSHGLEKVPKILINIQFSYKGIYWVHDRQASPYDGIASQLVAVRKLVSAPLVCLTSDLGWVARPSVNEGWRLNIHVDLTSCVRRILEGLSLALSVVRNASSGEPVDCRLVPERINGIED